VRAQLTVKALPNAEVYIDEEFKGHTGPDGGLRVSGVIPGTHVVRITAAGYQPSVQTVQVGKEGQTLVVAFEREAPAVTEEQTRHFERPGALDVQKVLGATAEGNNALAQHDQTLIDRLRQNLLKSVADFAQRNRFTYIIDVSSIPVYYLAPQADLTEEFTKVYASQKPTASVATPRSAAAQSKIGVINIQEAIGSTAEGKKAFADLSKKYQPRQQELQRLQQEIQAISDQLTKQAATLSDDEQRRLSRDLEDKQKLLKRSTEDAQTDFSTDRDEAIRPIGQNIVKLISEYARQNGYALVVDDVQVPVYYASKEIDLTEEILKRYDAGYRGLPSGTLNATRHSSSARWTRFINIEEAIASTAEGKGAFADLQKKYQPRQQELQRLQQEIQAINDRLTKHADTLSEEEQRRLRRELEDKQKLSKRTQEDAQADFSNDRDEAIRPIGQKMIKLIGEYARQNDIAIVWEVPIGYASPGLDLTAEIIKEYDVANPVQ
jgi:outer membrane protein